MRPELKYGLAASLAMSLWTLIEFWTGLHSTRMELGRYLNWVTDVMPAIFLYLLLKERFATLQRYWFPAWEGVLYGALTSLVAALGYYAFLNVYLHLINPSFVDFQLEWKVQHLRAVATPEADIRQQIVALRHAFGPVGLALTIPVYTLIGGCFSAVITLWLNWRQKDIAPLA